MVGRQMSYIRKYGGYLVIVACVIYLIITLFINPRG